MINSWLTSYSSATPSAQKWISTMRAIWLSLVALFIFGIYSPACYAQIAGLTKTDLGSPTPAGTYTYSAGSYTIGGGAGTGGNGIGGTSDSFTFVNTSTTGNIEIIAKVASQTNTNSYAIAGLMIRDSLIATGANALVSVSPKNGVNFSTRLTDGGATTKTLGPSIASPVWLRLVLTDTSIAGFESSDGISWVLVGNCTLTMPTTFYVGFAVESAVSGTTSTAVFSSVDYMTSVPQRSANLVSWLRADANVVYNGSNQVSSWGDQSSNGYNATQSTSANQPTLVASAINGLPAISFNGTSSILQFPTGFANFSSGASIFIVTKPAATTSSSQFLNLGTGSSNDYNIGIQINSSTKAEYFVYNSAGTTATRVAYGTVIGTVAQLLDAVQSGTSATIWTNGLTGVNNASMNSIPTDTSGRTNNYLGQGSGGANYFSGYIAEVLIYNTALTTVQRQAVETYLINKYGLP
jgi:hypothetical protein